MKRRDFFKRMGLGAGVAIAVPVIAKNISPEKEKLGITLVGELDDDAYKFLRNRQLL